MLNKLKCLLGKHDWVELFEPFFTYRESGIQVGYNEKYCYCCGVKK